MKRNTAVITRSLVLHEAGKGITFDGRGWGYDAHAALDAEKARLERAGCAVTDLRPANVVSLASARLEHQARIARARTAFQMLVMGADLETVADIAEGRAVA